MNALDFQVRSLAGVDVDLKHYQGQLVLVVNTASACGFTPQLQELEDLYQEYAKQGFVILGFPCNQFGRQEPGNAQEIAQFCEKNYGISFPMFEKIDVNGKNAHPFFTHLKKHAKGLLGTQSIKWNFTKFLINQEGAVIQRFGPRIQPSHLQKTIEKYLNGDSIPLVQFPSKNKEIR